MGTGASKTTEFSSATIKSESINEEVNNSGVITNTPPTTKANRIECYKARDAFFACLDVHEEGERSSCQDLCDIYESKCLPSWIKYFNERREMKNVPFEKQINGIPSSSQT